MPRPPLDSASKSTRSQNEVPPHEQRPRPVEVGEDDPISMPEYRISPADRPAVDGPIEDEQMIWPSRKTGQRDERIQNTVASKDFPDLNSLLQSPLTSKFRSQPVVDPQAEPLSAIGKLIIHPHEQLLHTPAVGSAWVIGPSVVATSAHNLYDASNETWARSMEFAPAYDYYAGESPTTCRVTSCYIPRAFMSNPTADRDIGICFVDRNIGDIIGTAISMRPVDGIDFFETNLVTIVGYPAGSHFDFGKQMWQSRGAYLMGQSTGPDRDYCPVVASDFGGGASGCPWLVKIDDEVLAVGVTSGHAKLRYDRGDVNLMSLTSPLFTEALFDDLSENHEFHEFG